jgi:flagellar M-ring protein FliF
MLDEKQMNFEKRLRNQVEDIVASVVGIGRARVQVAADMDNNRIQQTSETFDPEARVVRSTQNRNEDQTTTEVLDGQVSASKQLPGGQPSNTNQRDASTKSEETVNYEISKTTRTEMIEAGRIKRLSVAVLVDGTYTRDGQGQVTYKPREQAEIDRIIALVKSSIGFDSKRGDQVEVANLQFAQAPEIPPEPAELPWYDPSRFDMNRIIQLAILAFISLIVTFAIGRPLVRALASGSKNDRRSTSLNGEAESQQLMFNPVEQISGLITGNQEISIQTIRKWIGEKS